MPSPSDLTDWEYQKLAEFRYQVRRFLRLSEEGAREEGLESQQHQFLLAVRAHAGDALPTVGELADRLLIRHHSAVGLANRLADRGFVERVAGLTDRRRVHVQLTESGTALLARLSWLHREELLHFGPELLEALLVAVMNREAETNSLTDRGTMKKRA